MGLSKHNDQQHDEQIQVEGSSALGDGDYPLRERQDEPQLSAAPIFPVSGSDAFGQIRTRGHADACLQCHKCTAGCPMVERMDILPAQVVRLVQLGQEQELLQSRTIWLCASCHTCQTRCPAGVDLAGMHDGLRRLCLERGMKPAVARAGAFHRAMLATVEKDGRLNELGLVRRFKQLHGGYFEDLALGAALFYRGKISLRRSRVRDRRDVSRLVCEAVEPWEQG